MPEAAEIVDTPAEAANQERAPLIVREPLAAYLDSQAEVHAVDWRACGLEGFGKPTGYLDRQLRRFNGLWEHNKTREVPVVQEVEDWLGEHKPDSPDATIVHGDYRLGNTMVANDA